MKPMTLATVLNVLIVTGLMLLAPSGLKAQSMDSDQVTNLFTEVKQHAVLAENDAETLQSYTLSSVSWQSHAVRINAMKVHVNDLIADFNKAKDLQSLGSPWQQEAIDHLEPLVKSMADHLSAAIDHLNHNQNQVNLQPWHEYVRANRDYATRTAALIRDYLDYGEAASKVDDLEKKLELPAATGEE